MSLRFHLVASLLFCCSGASSVHGPPQQVLAFAGEDVILPCSFNVTARNDFPTVEWSKEGLQPDVIFLYRDGCETYEMKNPAFQYRTSLIVKELKNRNVSLRISSVRLSDEGKYKCMKLWKDAPREITTVTLVVVAVSEPKLSVVSAESGGVTLQCEANCWLPKPEISLLDDQGNIIPAEEPRRVRDDSGCYILTRKVTLRDATKRVTCRVHQPEINLTRTTEILIPVDCMRSCLLTTCIAGGGAVLLLLASCGLTGVLCKRCGKSAEECKLPMSRQSSDERTMSASENHPFLQSVRADKTDNVKNCTIEKLTREVAALKSRLYEKEETIRQLQNNLKPQLSPLICQIGQPTPVGSPSKCSPGVPDQFSPPSNHDLRITNDHDPKAASNYSNPLKSCNLPQYRGPPDGTKRKHRINSSPAVLNSPVWSSSSSNASKKKLGDIGRSKSLLGDRVGPNIPKLQRRHSSAFLPSAMSHNRFTLLTNLSEESD